MIEFCCEILFFLSCVHFATFIENYLDIRLSTRWYNFNFCCVIMLPELGIDIPIQNLNVDNKLVRNTRRLTFESQSGSIFGDSIPYVTIIGVKYGMVDFSNGV